MNQPERWAEDAQRAMPKRVTIVEVGPRDGLQAESTFVPTEVGIETGIETGIDLNAVVSIGEWISTRMGNAYGARAGKALAVRQSGS